MSCPRNLLKMFACFAMWLQPGCGNDTVGCVAGASSPCTCTNGASGAQVCRDDGTYGSCTCDGSSDDEGQASDGTSELENKRSSKNNTTSDRDDDPAPNDSSPKPSDSSGGNPSASPNRDDSTTPEDPPGNDTTEQEPDDVDPMADCETFPVNLTQSTTIAPGCYRVIAPPSFAESADLTISRGVTLYFDEGTWLEIPFYSILLASGTEANPIIFQGVSAKPGSWGGIRVRGGASLNYVTIQHAGGSIASAPDAPRAGLTVYGGDLELRHSRIAYNVGYGVANMTFKSIVAFENNVLTANQHPLLLRPDLVSRVGLTNELSGNEVDVVDLEGSSILHEETHTWVDLGIPYRLLETLVIREASLTLNGGVTLLFAPDTGLVVDDGSLVALGTEQAPVRLKAEDPDVGWPGIWRCDSPTINLANTEFVDLVPNAGIFYDQCASDGTLFTP